MTDPSVLLTGATGYLGHELAWHLARERIPFRAIGRAEGLDLIDVFGVAPRFEEILSECRRPPVLIHAAALAQWGACEAEPDVAWRINMEASGALMSVLHRRDGRMVYVSTDLVFDGEGAPYDERDEARPASVYGKTKLGGERMVLGSDSSLVARIPLLYGESFDGRRGASDPIIAALREGREVRLFTDEWRTPLHVREAAGRLVTLALDAGKVGIRHVPGPERLSRYELGHRVASEAGLDPQPIVAAARSEMPGPPRPADCSLATVPEEEAA